MDFFFIIPWSHSIWSVITDHIVYVHIEKECFFPIYRNAGAQLLQSNARNVHLIDQDAAARGLDDAEQRERKRCFAGTGASHNTDLKNII